MMEKSYYHIQDSNYCYAYSKDVIHLRLKTNDREAQKITVVFGDKFRFNESRKKELHFLSEETDGIVYQAEIPFVNRLAYYFVIESGGKTLYFTQWGLSDTFDKEYYYNYYFVFPYIFDSQIPVVPLWARGEVFYQIYVDSFFSSKENFSGNENKLIDTAKKPNYKKYYGGDLKGITEKLGYLDDLGVKGLYLTPVFLSETSHRYDTLDYYTIDKLLGSEDDLKTLVLCAHKRGMRVVLDGVFNHISSNSEMFQDVIKNGEKSRYKDWFIIDSFPINMKEPNFRTFSVYSGMPKLNVENKETADYLLGVICYWIEKADIDGWRLDVADELSPSFLRRVRARVKEIKPDSYIIGESWFSSTKFLLGDMFDSVMNYQFSFACQKFFALSEISSSQFRKMISKSLNDYSEQVNSVNFNLIETHDTSRFLSVAKGDVKRLKCAESFLLTFIGAPCLYYGSEIGMKGNGGEESRKAFDWNDKRQNKEIFNHVKSLIHCKNDSEALKTGSFVWIDLEDGIAFTRSVESESVVVIINAEKEDRTVNLSLLGISCGKVIYSDGYEGETLNENLVIPSYSTLIIKN